MPREARLELPGDLHPAVGEDAPGVRIGLRHRLGEVRMRQGLVIQVRELAVEGSLDQISRLARLRERMERHGARLIPNGDNERPGWLRCGRPGAARRSTLRRGTATGGDESGEQPECADSCAV